MPNYTLADGITLKNKLGATTHARLEQIEMDSVAARHLEIEAGLLPASDFTAAHLKSIHRHLFQDVFDWAGRTRNERVKLPDGSIATEPVMHKPGGKPFIAGPQITRALSSLASRIQTANYLQGLRRRDFAYEAASIFAALNAIHPFREGNGRTQRVFIEQLAAQARHELDFTVVSKERMICASIAAHEQHDVSMMQRLFDEISSPARCAVLGKAIGFLERSGFPWNDHYIATAEPGHRVELTMAGVAGSQFMARTASAILIGRTADLPEPHPEKGDKFWLELGIAAESETG